VRGIDPTAVPLLIAKTGFDTHTLPAWVITAASGPVAYIDVMLVRVGQRLGQVRRV
jgi:hypothetical protein